MPEQLREPLSLVFDGKEVPVEVVRADERRVWLTAPEQLPEALGSPLPVAVAWQGEGSERLLSNAIVLCVQPALQSARQYRPEGQRLPHIGALDLDDEEIEELLLEMEKTLVIDRADVFRAAGKTEAFVASQPKIRPPIRSTSSTARRCSIIRAYASICAGAPMATPSTTAWRDF